MNSFNNEDTFFELTQKAEQEEKDQHLQKCRVIHLWGASYYDKDEDFKSLIFFIFLKLIKCWLLKIIGVFSYLPQNLYCYKKD